MKEVDKAKTAATEKPTKWGALQDKESGEWKTVRFAFWPIAVIAIGVIAYLASMPAERLYDFPTQIWVFSALGLAFFILGSVVGYRNPEPRKLWILADFIWVMIVLFSLGKSLTPVENFLGQATVNGAIRNKAIAHENVLRKTWEAQDQLCPRAGAQPGSAESALCTTLRGLERELSLPASRPSKDIVEAVKSASFPGELGELNTLIGIYDKSWENVGELEAKRGQINLWLPYLQILIVTLALGLRAGRTGAEFRREVDKVA